MRFIVGPFLRDNSLRDFRIYSCHNYFLVCLIKLKNSHLASAAAEGKAKRYNDEAEHNDRYVNIADHSPTVEPNLAVNAERLHCAPKAVREVKPDSGKQRM